MIEDAELGRDPFIFATGIENSYPTIALPDGPLLFFWILTLDRLVVALRAPGRIGPWIGVDVSDKRGLIMDVVLQARIGAGEPKWFWVYEYRGNRRASREEEIQSGDVELSKQHVIELLADRYQKASANRR